MQLVQTHIYEYAKTIHIYIRAYTQINLPAQLDKI